MFVVWVKTGCRHLDPGFPAQDLAERVASRVMLGGL
jgi:hypothetical protein